VTKRVSSLLGYSMCCAVLLQADFQPSRWKYRRPLVVDSTARLMIWNVDRGTYTHSQPDLSDLRVVNRQGEVPYVIEKMSGSHRRADISRDVIDQGVSERGDHGRSLELTVDVGAGHRHNGIRLSTSRANFRQRVGIATSDDGRRWTRVRDDGYIFDFSADDRQISVLYVGYPVSSRRYVRATIYGWNDPHAVTDCWVTIEEDQPSMRDTMASLKPEPSEDTKTQSTIYAWDLGVAGIPYDQLALDIDTPEFQRAAAVETSTDGQNWSVLGQGVLSKFAQEASLKLNFGESHQRYLRLRIYNRDDKPLAVKSGTLSVIRTRLKFKPAGGGAYWLYFGNAEAHAASYDLRSSLARDAPTPDITISAGAEEVNPSYREKHPPAKPWSEQHPEILYVILALAVVGMGIVTIRFLKKAGAANP
jgi:hypothetical protein